ncbi:MAG TPA: HET-C-related protein [Ktedonobacterales bacterium]|nr:HET-C-related protein [Ktedonobacterales bacterium]
MLVSVHVAIVRAALGDMLAPAALGVVTRANARCDLYQWEAHRHFDNGRDVTALGALWRRGLRRYLTLAVERTTPADGRDGRRDKLGALRALGMASHALADFYAHTNWVELHGADAPQAPLLRDEWPAEALPADLASGYFSLRYGLRGCPMRDGVCVPPDGYRYCHETLNKDAPTRGHGADTITPGGPTFHTVAVRLAEDGTRALWQALRAEVTAVVGQSRADAALARINGTNI